MAKTVLVTGAFSYIGAAVAEELMRRGHRVRTLTNRAVPTGLEETVPTQPLRFEKEFLVGAMKGVDVFINTYWIRFPHAGQTFQTAIVNSERLFEAARDAGVGRIVHVSVSNPDRGSDLGYYRGKADVEWKLRQNGVPHAIVRPTLVVGPGDVLTNNIGWLLRRFPVFALPQGGRCRLQPVTLRETARIICDNIDGPDGSVVDAAGPETFSFAYFVRRLAALLNVRRFFLPVPNGLALACLAPLGKCLRDTILTAEELLGLEQELLVSRRPPLSGESVWPWLEAHRTDVGRVYVNDKNRHFGSGKTKPLHDSFRADLR